MDRKMFFSDLIILDRAFQNSDDFFDFIFPILKEKGYVRDSFLTAIKTRESQFPTALPTEPYVVALPHTDIEHIIRPFIAVTRVKNTVPWNEMGNNDAVLDARFIFLLGFIDKNGHINLLQTLMGCFSDKHFIEMLINAKTENEVVQFLESTVMF